MSKNVLSMAEFIYTHPEYRFLKPQIWKIHYRLECGVENGISCFKVLQQYSTLVQTKPIHEDGSYSVYASAQITEETFPPYERKDVAKSKIEQIKKMIDDLSTLVNDLEY